jgi:hypothetical protein
MLWYIHYMNTKLTDQQLYEILIEWMHQANELHYRLLHTQHKFDIVTRNMVMYKAYLEFKLNII